MISVSKSKKLKRIIVLVIGFCFINWNISRLSAQTSPGEFVFNASPGISLYPLWVMLDCQNNLPAQHEGLPNGTYVTYQNPFTYAYSAGVDYAVTADYSLGIGITNQKSTIQVTNWYDYQNYIYENVTETINRLNVRVRGLYHWGYTGDYHWEEYAGAAIGYSKWSDHNSATYPGDFPNDAPYKRSTDLPSFQGIFGVRGYFIPNLGIHLELAIGSPYCADLGLSLRLGGTAFDKRAEEEAKRD